jgi:hypothetical protein
LLVLLVAASYGGVIPTVTDVSRADAGRLHRCSFDRCGRVERVLFDDPVCSGTPERTHTATVATPIDDDGAVVPTDDRHLFA